MGEVIPDQGTDSRSTPFSCKALGPGEHKGETRWVISTAHTLNTSPSPGTEVPYPQPEPWAANQPDVEVYTTVPFLIPGEQADTVKRALTLAMIAERYPQEAWTHVYTDCSATNAVADGSAGISYTRMMRPQNAVSPQASTAPTTEQKQKPSCRPPPLFMIDAEKDLRRNGYLIRGPMNLLGELSSSSQGLCLAD